MKISFWAIAACFLLAVLIVISIPIPLSAQGSRSESTDFSRSEIGYMEKPYRSYAEYALDLILRRTQNHGLGVSIDPQEYIVGPGDEFTIYFVSGDIPNIVCRIGIGGKLFIKSVGSLEVSGITLQDAVEEIRTAVRKNFTNTDFDIQLTDFRLVQINVIGEVMQPGIYYAPAVWRVSEVLDLTGGLTPEASNRKIELRGASGEFPVDLLRFSATGDKKANPFINKGRTIAVPSHTETDDYVTISGLVNRPRIVEVSGGDHLADYIAYARGTSGDLQDMTISVSSRNESEVRRMDGADPKVLDFVPSPGDNIVLAWKEGKQKFGTVTILGEVTHPGKYSIASGQFNLNDLLSQCGGFTADGCSEMIQIYRLIPDYVSGASIENLNEGSLPVGSSNFSGSRRDGFAYNKVSFNPRGSMDLSQFMLTDGDSLFIPRATGMVSVTGAVASPGLIHFRKGKNVDFYLKEAGGLGFDADEHRMVVYNPHTGGRISADEAGELFDSEILFVPRKETGTKP